MDLLQLLLLWVHYGIHSEVTLPQPSHADSLFVFLYKTVIRGGGGGGNQ